MCVIGCKLCCNIHDDHMQESESKLTDEDMKMTFIENCKHAIKHENKILGIFNHHTGGYTRWNRIKSLLMYLSILFVSTEGETILTFFEPEFADPVKAFVFVWVVSKVCEMLLAVDVAEELLEKNFGHLCCVETRVCFCIPCKFPACCFVQFADLIVWGTIALCLFVGNIIYFGILNLKDRDFADCHPCFDYRADPREVGKCFPYESTVPYQAGICTIALANYYVEERFLPALSAVPQILTDISVNATNPAACIAAAEPIICSILTIGAMWSNDDKARCVGYNCDPNLFASNQIFKTSRDKYDTAICRERPTAPPTRDDCESMATLCGDGTSEVGPIIATIPSSQFDLSTLSQYTLYDASGSSVPQYDSLRAILNFGSSGTTVVNGICQEFNPAASLAYCDTLNLDCYAGDWSTYDMHAQITEGGECRKISEHVKFQPDSESFEGKFEKRGHVLCGEQNECKNRTESNEVLGSDYIAACCQRTADGMKTCGQRVSHFIVNFFGGMFIELFIFGNAVHIWHRYKMLAKHRRQQAKKNTSSDKGMRESIADESPTRQSMELN